MIRQVTFEPKVLDLPRLEASVVPAEVITDEPMLYSASPLFAQTYGGPLTQAALGQMQHFMENIGLPPGCHWVIDTRSHMLMPGQYPAIGGWHCDAVPRAHYNAQPDLDRMNRDVWHLTAHVSTHKEGVSSTLFLIEPLTLDIDTERVWASAHEGVKKYEPETLVCAPMHRVPGDGAVVAFNQPTLHRAARTVHRGWRWWIRASMYYARPINKIRRHVQVYTSAEGAGW